jgi:glycine oxidase
MTSLSGKPVHIAGAGVIGLSLAAELAGDGARVTVFDPEPVGRASAVAAGMLAPVFESILDPASSDSFELLLAARDLWPSFAGRHGIALDRCGATYQGRRLAHARAVLSARGLTFEAWGEGLFTPDDWRLDARPSLERLRASAEQGGAVFVNDRLEAPAPGTLTVIATGSSPFNTAPETALITAIKGQIIHVTRTPLTHRADGPVERRDGGYIAPGRDGARVGATMQPGESDLSPDPAIEAIVPGAFPELISADALGFVETGIRGATPDGLPLVGPSARSGVWLAMGMRRNGWLLAPLVASMIRAYLAGDDPGPWAERLDARRFTAPDLEE